MINGLSGRPGAGKSYEAVVTHILPALKQGRKIVTNIPLSTDWFASVLGEHVRELIVLVDGDFHSYGKQRPFSQANDFLQYQDWRNDNNQGVYFFIDECHLAMPQGSTDKNLKEYMSMHRHYGHDIMLLTQNFRKVDRDVKDMVQNCYYCTKLSFLGKDESYVVKVADGVSRNIVTTHQRKYDPKYYPAYQSHTKSEGAVKEATTSDVVKWYNRWTTRGAAACVALSLLILIGQLSADRPDHQAEALKKLEQLKTEPQTPQQVSQANPYQPVTSQPQPQPQQALPSKPEKPPEAKHPFAGVNLHLSGYHADRDNRGRFNKVYYFALSRNGSMLTEITHVDLQLAGYTVKILNSCVAELSYGDYNAFVLCDTPTQGVTLAGEQLTASLE
jgi:zona occludens toxin